MSGNNATRGGGIHATSSTVAVYAPGTLQFDNNRAENGGGLYLGVTAKLQILKSRFQMNDYLVRFVGNHACYGGAIYVAEETQMLVLAHLITNALSKHSLLICFRKQVETLKIFSFPTT